MIKLFCWKDIVSCVLNNLWCVLSGLPVCQLKMQKVLPQQVEAIKAYLDSHVQEAAQKGKLAFLFDV